MLAERAWLDGLAALLVLANKHSIRDIQLDQVFQFGRDIVGALVIHIERVMWSAIRYWAPIPFALTTRLT